MGSLLLLLALAARADDAPETPAPRDELVVTSEVEGNGNDETARRLEGMLKARRDEVLACRTVVPGEPEPLRFLQLHVQVSSTKGHVKKWKVTSSTGAEHVDACVTGLVSALVWDPPPIFADRLQLNVTWVDPTTRPQ